MSQLVQNLYRSIYQKSFKDYLLWISVVLYLDPGGYFLHWNIIRFSKTYFLLIIWAVFLNVTNFKGLRISFRDKIFKRAVYICVLFVLYYIIVFLIIKNDYTHLSLTERFMKTRLDITGWLLIIPIYYFAAYRSSRLFISVFLGSSFIIAFLLVLTMSTGLEFVFLHEANRGYVNVTRILLDGAGIMELGLYMLIAVFILPKSFYFKTRNRLIYSCLSIYLVFLLTLTRRYIVFVAIAIGAAYFISKYLFGRRTHFQSRIISALVIITIVIAVFFNSYLDGVLGSVETLNVSKNNSYGTTYNRLSLFEQIPTINMFSNNMIFGSGYINEYYSKFDKPIYGLEGSDYVFLSSLAMFGIVGVLLFLPFYLVLYKAIIKGMKTLKQNISIIRVKFFIIWPSLILFLSSTLFFIKHLISYPNWFSFFGPSSFSEMYFIFAGLLFGSIRNIENNLFIIKKQAS